jgi:outer membrane protein assembly factor BamB
LRRWRRQAGLLAALVVLAGCGGTQELILPGARFDTDVPLDQTVEAAEAGPVAQISTTAPAARGGPAPIRLPAPVNHAAWTHRNGGVAHTIAHPALSPAPAPLWTVPIGRGETRRHRITADPVVAGGRVFTLDATSALMAHDAATGATLWSRNLARSTDRARDATGGRLSVAGDTIYATTGFGDLVALSVANGAERWRQRADAPIAGGVTVSDGMVYAVGRDGRALALDAATGRILWAIEGSGTVVALTDGPAPVVTDRLAIFPFPDGDIVAVLKRNGIRVWQSRVSGREIGRSGALVGGVTGDPVVSGGRVYAGNFGGRTIAIDAASGERLWTARNGAVGPVWPVGGALFLVTPENALVRLDAASGEMVWSRDLPFFVRGNRRPFRWRETFVHHGPVLAGGRLWLAASDGALRGFDPVSGAAVVEVALPGGAASAPVVVAGTLYVVSRDGRLHALR